MTTTTTSSKPSLIYQLWTFAWRTLEEEELRDILSLATTYAKEKRLMKIAMICPVRGLGVDELHKLKQYVHDLRSRGHEVYWPFEDPDQQDTISLRMCKDNRRAIEDANEVHVWWNPTSLGSHFDLGMAFALNKHIVWINKADRSISNPGSLERFLHEIDEPEEVLT